MSAAPARPNQNEAFMKQLMQIMNKAPTTSSDKKTTKLVTPRSRVVSDPPDKQEKKQRLRNNVITEIYETEKSYLEQLNALDELYIKPIQESQTAEGGEPLLKKEYEEELFSNIRVIRDLNSRFCEDLAKCVATELKSVGKVFLTFLPFFKTYKVYVVNHAKATQRLNKLLSGTNASSTAFQKFHNENMQKPASKGLNLTSLLITPIQRVPRYKLLLTEVIKNTQPNHPDVDDLEQALDLVSQVASDIDLAINVMNNRDTILSLQDQFLGNVELVTPSRALIRKGMLTKVGRRAGPRKFFFVLFNDLLIYADVKGKKYKLHRQLPFDDAFEISDDVAGEVDEKMVPLAWKIVNSVKSFVVYAANDEEKKEWMNDLKETITKYRGSGIHRSPVSSTAPKKAAKPVWASDKNRDSCPICGKKFTTFFRKHHCRKCGTLCCADCSKTRSAVPQGLPASLSSGSFPSSASVGAMEDQGKKKRICNACAADFETPSTSSRGSNGSSAHGGSRFSWDTSGVAGSGGGAGGGLPASYSYSAGMFPGSASFSGPAALPPLPQALTRLIDPSSAALSVSIPPATPTVAPLPTRASTASSGSSSSLPASSSLLVPAETEKRRSSFFGFTNKLLSPREGSSSAASLPDLPTSTALTSSKPSDSSITFQVLQSGGFRKVPACLVLDLEKQVLTWSRQKHGKQVEVGVYLISQLSLSLPKGEPLQLNLTLLNDSPETTSSSSKDATNGRAKHKSIWFQTTQDRDKFYQLIARSGKAQISSPLKLGPSFDDDDGQKPFDRKYQGAPSSLSSLALPLPPLPNPPPLPPFIKCTGPGCSECLLPSSSTLTIVSP